jgi:hypothetical protein
MYVLVQMEILQVGPNGDLILGSEKVQRWGIASPRPRFPCFGFWATTRGISLTTEPLRCAAWQVAVKPLVQTGPLVQWFNLTDAAGTCAAELCLVLRYSTGTSSNTL